MRRLRVAVDARFNPGTAGGVETVVMGLAQGLANLAPDDFEFAFLTYRGRNEWMRPYVGGSVRCHEVSSPGRSSAIRHKMRPWAIRRAGTSYSALPARDRVLAGMGADVVHIPFQGRGWVPQPSIYHPHDLQHRYLPEFFTPRQRAWREVVYGANCRRATAIAVGTTWVRNDLIRQMKIDAAKIFVVPLAPFRAGTAHGHADRGRYGLPPRYLAYPAAAWPHKNHETLFDALAVLRAQGTLIPLVLTGSRQFGVNLSEAAASRGLGDLVYDLGYVPQEDVEFIVREATAVVVPSLFEAASFPIWEAMRVGTPVTCANITSLPGQVSDAALMFEPRSPESIADCIKRLWCDQRLRAELSERGRRRVETFTWERTARHFLALYRLLGRRPLHGDDESLLFREPLL